MFHSVYKSFKIKNERNIPDTSLGLVYDSGEVGWKFFVFVYYIIWTPILLHSINKKKLDLDLRIALFVTLLWLFLTKKQMAILKNHTTQKSYFFLLRNIISTNVYIKKKMPKKIIYSDWFLSYSVLKITHDVIRSYTTAAAYAFTWESSTRFM